MNYYEITVCFFALCCLAFFLGRMSAYREIVLSKTGGGFRATIRTESGTLPDCTGAGASKAAALGNLILENKRYFKFIGLLYSDPGSPAFLYYSEEMASTAAVENRVREQHLQAMEKQA